MKTTNKIIISSWMASGLGATAGSSLECKVVGMYNYIIVGKLKYSGSSATGNNLSFPHFGDEFEKYGDHLISLIGKYIEIPRELVQIDHISTKNVLFEYIGEYSRIKEHTAKVWGVSHLGIYHAIGSENISIEEAVLRFKKFQDNETKNV